VSRIDTTIFFPRSFYGFYNLSKYQITAASYFLPSKRNIANGLFAFLRAAIAGSVAQLHSRLAEPGLPHDTRHPGKPPPNQGQLPKGEQRPRVFALRQNPLENKIVC
jgi:hypothetical protein